MGLPSLIRVPRGREVGSRLGRTGHTVPRVLQDSSTDAVAQLCVHDPAPVPLIVALLSLADFLLGGSKLRTAAHTHIARHLFAGEEVLEGLLVVATSMHSFPVLAFLVQGLDLAGASKQPCAPDVDISLLLEIWYLEMSKHGQTIVVGVIIVPLVAIWVNKEHVVRELVVMIDDVAGQRALIS
jgi:hypothetical protein